MLNREHEILEVFVENPLKKFTFKQVKNISGKKSESYIYNTLKKFVKTGILAEEKIGNTALYSANISFLKAQVYLGFASEFMAWNKSSIPYHEIEKISKKNPADFYTLLITGSYANGSQKKNSDIDIVIICGNKENPEKIYSELRHDCEMNIPTIHLYAFKKSEFIGMLTSQEANYGKEIAKNNLILSGGKEYFRMIDEASKNEFNG